VLRRPVEPAAGSRRSAAPASDPLLTFYVALYQPFINCRRRCILRRLQGIPHHAGNDSNCTVVGQQPRFRSFV